MQVMVGGLLTQYEMIGEGKTVIMLHGWGDHSLGFRDLIAALSPRYRVITPDLPGFGGSQAPNGAWGLDDYASFVAQFLKKLNVSGPDVIIGHSNGGAIALRGLAKEMLTTKKLVLLASAGIRGEYKGRNKALRVIAKTGKLLVAPLPKSAKHKLRARFYRHIGSDMLVAEHLQETFKKIITDDVRADAATIQVPTLIIYGSEDRATPARYGEILHRALKGSKMMVLPGAGHFIHHERPGEVASMIEEFLR